MRIRGLTSLILLSGLMTGSIAGCGGSGAKTPGAPKVLANEPNVTFKDLNGQDVPLASLKGKVVVVNFWATGASPAAPKFPG